MGKIEEKGKRDKCGDVRDTLIGIYWGVVSKGG